MSARAILVVRPDRIGDLVLTTPMFRALRAAWPDARIGALVRPGPAPLLEHNPDVDTIVLERDQPLGGLARELRAGKWDASVHAFLTSRTALAAALAGIPRRIGPASKLPALLLTERLVQHRSRSVRHEAEYNLELLAPLGIHASSVAARLELTADERAWAAEHLASLGLPPGRPFVIVHPGLGNSAARWPIIAFRALADGLLMAGHETLATFGPGEEDLLGEYRALRGSRTDEMRRRLQQSGTTEPMLAPGRVTLRQLAAVIARAALFVSNSTGPLHMAVALGVPTVSFFGLTPATRQARWGPYPPAGHVVLTPPDQPETQTALDLITVNEALEACLHQLAARGAPAPR